MALVHDGMIVALDAYGPITPTRKKEE